MDEEKACERLQAIDHIIVLMMENRSFDHMLGYLSLPADQDGCGRKDVDGLTGPKRNFNRYKGTSYRIAPVSSGGLTKVQDPAHSGWCVGQQMAHGMSGFVANYATTRAYQHPGDVMSYQTAEHVPTYDFLAEEFAVCDRWFCSVPGSTWPNRVSSLAGEARSKDNKFPPLYSRASFVRSLPDDVTWRWYSSDPGSLRLVDDKYRIGHEDHFAFAEKPTLVQRRTFYTDVMAEELPNVAWIDPNFVDLGGLQGANDDHPPTDVMAGQSFVLKIYQALTSSALWEKSMLVIVYDEHGGFYDHVDPLDGFPDEFTSRAEFSHFGPRVPALVVSPFVARGSAFGSAQGDEQRFLFDHTAIIKTILLRFADGLYTGLPDRVASASHLGHLLEDGPARDAPEVPLQTIGVVANWWSGHIADQLMYPLARIPALAELGVVEGPTGAQAIAQGLLGLIGRVRDWLSRRARRLRDRVFGRDPASAGPESLQPGTPALKVLTDASELELGVAAASREIRRKGLRSGQP